MRRERRGAALADPPADDYLRAWRARHTVAAWRAADQVLRRSPASPARRAHEAAVAVALAGLLRFDSVEALVEHARVDGYRRSTDSGEPPDGSVEAWIAAAQRRAGGGRRLDASLVEGAALWRRVAQLTGELAG
jgi:hypothetical protein